ncbi:MAG TPA: SDR family oxidoreductase [Chitinophagaceae bacterium]|jgi:3-oxoacyl-[acyl-carrier protein] reductase|nr:SDR family oxidoreductase [Chitinophagaceae bacterium]
MNISLTGKTALVCGSTQGIGLAIATELALLGATCILMARNEDSLKKAIAGLDRAGGQQHSFVVADFASNDSVSKAIEKLIAAQSIGILINNTGGPPPGPMTEATPGELEAAFRQHILNYQVLTQAVLPGMKRASFGRIVNIVSTSVKIPIANLGISNTIRAATAAWAKTLSLEVAQFGITVNNILPGYTMTQRLESLVINNASKAGVTKDELSQRMKLQIPARRFGEASEIAAVAAFLASPAASYVNGVNLPVDGGSTGAF